jgi:glyoxylase-like metal-dependent hydrolase (beta-lactamase superfamily II)
MIIFRAKKHLFFVILISLLLFHSGFAQELQSTKSNEPQPIKVAEGLYVLEDSGCNITVSTGPDGTLVIDSGYKSQAEQNKARIAAISPGPIRFIINTHFHYDHVGGNGLFAKEGAIIVAHENARMRMSEEWKGAEILGMTWPTIPPYPKNFIPTLCFKKDLTIHFNNDIVRISHVPGGHSDSDAIIFFRKSHVIHVGDLFLSHSFPIIDIFHGGSVSCYIAGIDRIIGMCDDETTIIPGHGPISDLEDLRSYRNMLILARDRIEKLMEEGKTLEEIVAADPTAGLLKDEQKSWLPPKIFVYCVYQELLEHSKTLERHGTTET